jgi:hypothetical protein
LAKDAASMPFPPRLPKAAVHRTAALLCALLFAGCQPVMSTSTMSGHANEEIVNPASAWPLRFSIHNFGAHCFDTQRCEILYRGFPHGEKDNPAPSVASYGRPLEKLLTAGRGPIPNFPPPAKVTWISKDGTPLDAEVDLGEIFKDQLIRHNVPREEISTVGSLPPPEIILEVNDRTINVYMRATIWTKKLQIPGNRFSNQRNDLIKVYSRTY